MDRGLADFFLPGIDIVCNMNVYLWYEQKEARQAEVADGSSTEATGGEVVGAGDGEHERIRVQAFAGGGEGGGEVGAVLPPGLLAMPA